MNGRNAKLARRIARKANLAAPAASSSRLFKRWLNSLNQDDKAASRATAARDLSKYRVNWK